MRLPRRGYEIVALQMLELQIGVVLPREVHERLEEGGVRPGELVPHPVGQQDFPIAYILT